MQRKQQEWVEQWSRFKDDSLFLFQEWICPATVEDFAGMRVLDAGCGHGHHIRMVASRAREVVGVDLNTAEIARQETQDLPNVRVVEGDLASVDFPELFDVVYCLGVIHHTDDPDISFANLKRLTRPGGRLIVWTYSYEGNFLNRTVVEWAKRAFLGGLPVGVLLLLSYAVTMCLYPLVWSVYLLPLRGMLPFYDYFGNFRILPFKKNAQNVFDKLIAPQAFFIRREQVERWFDPRESDQVHISNYKGVSWRCSGVKK